MSWPRSGSHGTTISLLLCLDLTKGQPSCPSVACWIPLPHRSWEGFVREMLPQPSLPEVNYSHLVFPQMSYFGCSTWDCSEGPDFLKVLSALFQKCHPLRSEKLKVIRVLRNLGLHFRAKVQDETSSGIKCWGARSSLETTTPKAVPPRVVPERGGNSHPMVLCTSNPKMPGPPAGMALTVHA